MESVLDVCVQENEKDRQQYKNSTYMLVSKIAYLIGVPEQILQGEHVPAKMRETYEELDKIKEARIIRNFLVTPWRRSLSRKQASLRLVFLCCWVRVPIFQSTTQFASRLKPWVHLSISLPKWGC